MHLLVYISGHPVKSIYIEHNRILRADLHHMFNSRPNEFKGDEIYRIMWTRTQPSRESWWTPNHFVPCINQLCLQAPCEQHEQSNLKLTVPQKDGFNGNDIPQRKTLTLADFLTTCRPKNKKGKFIQKRNTDYDNKMKNSPRRNVNLNWRMNHLS